jgi:hypothetical protein
MREEGGTTATTTTTTGRGGEREGTEQEEKKRRIIRGEPTYIQRAKTEPRQSTKNKANPSQEQSRNTLTEWAQQHVVCSHTHSVSVFVLASFVSWLWLSVLGVLVPFPSSSLFHLHTHSVTVFWLCSPSLPSPSLSGSGSVRFGFGEIRVRVRDILLFTTRIFLSSEGTVRTALTRAFISSIQIEKGLRSGCLGYSVKAF